MKNREIKFRAWNKTQKCMDYEFSIHADGCLYQDAKRRWDIADIAVETAYDELVIMQFTGLTDRNEKEIYEGDILRHPPKDDWEKTNYACFEVFWHDNDAADRHIGFQLNRVHLHGSLGGYGGGESMLPKWTKQLEIIGNVFETPELLRERTE